MMMMMIHLIVLRPDKLWIINIIYSDHTTFINQSNLGIKVKVKLIATHDYVLRLLYLLFTLVHELRKSVNEYLITSDSVYCLHSPCCYILYATMHVFCCL